VLIRPACLVKIGLCRQTLPYFNWGQLGCETIKGAGARSEWAGLNERKPKLRAADEPLVQNISDIAKSATGPGSLERTWRVQRGAAYAFRPNFKAKSLTSRALSTPSTGGLKIGSGKNG
jgi:hypothetical protein